MRCFTLFCLAAIGAALETPSAADVVVSQGVADYAPAITVLETNKSYLVKLECRGCPLAVRKSAHKTGWQHDRDNSLLLKVDFDASKSLLYLNGDRVLPLDPMPLYMNAMQVPSDTSKAVMGQYIDKDLKTAWPLVYGVHSSLQYEHTLVRTKEPEISWLQFDVTGLSRAEHLAPVKLNNENQELLQILLRQQIGTKSFSIEDVQLVQRQNRAQPYKMKCGELAMVQTTFDPNEWDDFGKIGTWARTGNVVLRRGYEIWQTIQDSPLVLVLALLFAVSMVLVRHRYVRRQRVNAIREEEDEIALLGFEYRDAPPAYANIPTIKIEEYD